MSFNFTCPNCGKTYSNVDDELRGRKIRCKCGNKVRLGSVNIQEHQSQAQPAAYPGVPTAIPVADPLSVDPYGQTPATWQDPLATPATAWQQPVTPTVAPLAVKPRGSDSYSKYSILRVLLGMVSGTLLVLFSFLAFMLCSSIFEFGRDAPFANNPAGNRFTSLFAGMIVFGIIAGIVAVGCLVSGIIQFIAAWLQLVRQNRDRPWPDVLAASFAVISVVALIGTWLYLVFQVNEVRSLQMKAFDMNESAFANQGFPDSRGPSSRMFQEERRQINKTFGEVQWQLVKQVLVHAIIPSIVLGLSLFRVLHE